MNKFYVQGMSGFDRHNQSPEGAAQEKEIAQKIQNLMPDTFVREPQAIPAEDIIFPDNHGIFQTGSFDQSPLQ